MTSSSKSNVVSEVQDSARDFLLKHGLGSVVPTIVEQNKFETVDSLMLLAKSDDLPSLLKMMEIPLCYVLMLRKVLESINIKEVQPETVEKAPSKMTDETMSDAVDKPSSKGKAPTTTKDVAKIDKQEKKEISKQDLLKLGKNNLEAQQANCKWDQFNSILSRLVNKASEEGQWKGNGALKVSAGTTFEEAQANCVVASKLIDDEELRSLFGSHDFPGLGRLELSSPRAKTFIGQKLSHGRKQSCYKGVGEKKGCKKKEELHDNGDESRKKACPDNEDLDQNGEDVPFKKGGSNTKACPDNEDLDQKGEDVPFKKGGSNTKEDNLSEYERSRIDKMKENKLQMIHLGLISKEAALVVTLFYTKTKKLSDLKVERIKSLCKTNGIKYSKGDTKESLCTALGRSLFGTEDTRLNEDDIVKYNNLKRC